MKRTRASAKPVAVTNRRLNLASESVFRSGERIVETVAVWSAENEHVDVPNRALTSLPGVACCPRSVHVGRLDSRDSSKGIGDDGGDPECPRQHVGEPREVRAVCVGPNEAGVPDLPARDEPSLLCPLDLAVDRGMRGPGPLRQLSQARLEIGISQEERKDHALLLRAQDRQQYWRWSSFHKMKNTLQFAEVPRPASCTASTPRRGTASPRSA